MKALGVVLVLVGAVVAIVFVAQFRTMQAMQAEVAALRADRDAAAKAARASRASVPAPDMSRQNNNEELGLIREELAALRTEMKQISTAQADLKAAMADALPLQMIAANEWKNAGRATPAAAMETIYWAALAGELDVLAESMIIPDEDRAKVDTWFASLPETARRQYGTPEQLIGLLVAKEAGPLTGMQVLAQNEINDTDVMLNVRFAMEDGGVDSAEYLLRRTSDGGWRLVIPADGVEWFARHLKPEN